MLSDDFCRVLDRNIVENLAISEKNHVQQD